MKKKLKKEVKIHKFLVCAYNSQDFAQTQENFARSQDRATVTFRNSGPLVLRQVNTFLYLCSVYLFVFQTPLPLYPTLSPS